MVCNAIATRVFLSEEGWATPKREIAFYWAASVMIMGATTVASIARAASKEMPPTNWRFRLFFILFGYVNLEVGFADIAVRIGYFQFYLIFAWCFEDVIWLHFCGSCSITKIPEISTNCSG